MARFGTSLSTTRKSRTFDTYAYTRCLGLHVHELVQASISIDARASTYVCRGRVIAHLSI